MRFLNIEKVQWVRWCLYYENLPRRRSSRAKISMQRLPLSNRFESQPIRKRFRQKQGKPINRVNFENFATNQNHKKSLAVFKLDYVIILVIITVPFAIGMTFAQSLDWLFKTGIFLRKESVEVRDLQSTVHRLSMDRSWSISWSAKSSFRQLNALYKKMLINIEEQNPQLFSFVEELQQIKKLRQGKINFWEVNFGHFSSWGLKVYGSKSKTNQPRYRSLQIYRWKNRWG